MGDLYVAGFSSNNVVQFDGETGALVGEFVPSGSGGLEGPKGLAFGPNGNLFVCSRETEEILEYDGTTGAFARTLIVGGYTNPDGGWMQDPVDLIFRPDGRVLVAAELSRAVHAFDASDGTWLGTWAIGGEGEIGGLDSPESLTVGPNGNIFATSLVYHIPVVGPSYVFEYHATTGRLVRVFATMPGLPLGSVWRDNGNLLVVEWQASLSGSADVKEYDGSSGASLGVFASGGGLTHARGLTFGPNGNLFVSGKINGTPGVMEFDGATGEVVGPFATGMLLGASYLTFKPAPPTPTAPPTVTGVSASEVDACAGLSGLTITGTNLDAAGTMVRLTKTGEADFVGRVTGGSEEGTSLTVDFDLDGGIIATGPWDVVVTSPDGQSDTLEAAINVTGCRSARTRNLLATAYRRRGNHTAVGIIEYEGQTGDLVGWFVEDRTQEADFGELWAAPGMTVGPDGDVFVACGRAGSSAGDGAHAVVRFDGITGRRLGVFVPAESGGLERPFGLTFGPNGNLFVVDRPWPPAIPSAVFEYDGFSGAFVRVVVERGACGLTNGRELLFSEDGSVLLVTSEDNGVMAFDSQLDACVAPLGDTGDPPGDVVEAVSFSPYNGNLVVVKATSRSAVEYDAETGSFARTLVDSGSGGWQFAGEGSATFGPNDNYFVTSVGPGEVLEYDGTSGAFLRSFSSVESDAGVASNFDLVFGPIPADADGDWDLDLGDFAVFQRCFAGDGVSPARTTCLVFDNDGDGDVDVGDAAAFAAEITGPA